MVRRTDANVSEQDERLGEAVEEFLSLAETGHAPDPDEFVAKYPDLADDLRAALDGLSLVRGLVSGPGDPGQKLEAGRRVAGYKIVRELGRGGMGVVYEAVHVDLDRPVALKVLGAHAAPDSTGRRRFLNEARTAAGLHHTHIVPVFDVGQVGGLCYYAMQRIEGCGLDRVIRRLRRDRSTAAGSSIDRPARPASDGTKLGPGMEDTISWSTGGQGGALRGRTLEGDAVQDDEPPPFEPARGTSYYRWVATAGRQAAEALAHAHGRGVIHRDIKPSNLLVDARGTIWVADFGLSRRLADPELTQSDSRLGTPRYMSPEQTRIGPVDSRSDVYSLGATLYELLALRPPFDGRSPVELAQQILDREALSPRRFDPKIPRDLETIVLKAMAKRPSDRYASAQELSDDLERFLVYEPVRARRISPVGRLWRLSRRHPQVALVTVAAVAAIVSVVTVAYIRIARERDRALLAEGRATESLGKEKAARREALLRESKLIVHGLAPNRRERGFPRLKEAASLEPGSELKARLRDEAVALFALRDVEARQSMKTEPSRALLFGSLGARLATLSEDGREFSLWDTETFKRVNRQALTAAVVSGEPTPLGGQGADGRPAARTPPRGRMFGDDQRTLFGLASPSLFAVVPPNNRGIRLFDAMTGSPERNLELQGRQIQSIFTSPTASRLVTIEVVDSGPARNRPPDGGETKNQRSRAWVVNLWNSEALDQPIQKLVELPVVDPFPPMVALSPDGDQVATALPREPTVSVWSAVDGTLKVQIPTPTSSTALALGPEGLLAEAGGGLIRLWQVSDKAEAAALPSLNTHQGTVSRLRFSPDGTMLATSSGRAPGLANSGRAPSIELWDLVTDPLSTLSAVLRTPDDVADLAFSANGRMLAASVVNPQQSTGSVSVWAIVEPVGRVRLPELKSVPTALTFSRDGELAIASRDESLRLWRAGECPTIPRVLGGVLASGASFDAQGRLETTDGRFLRRFPRIDQRPSHAADAPAPKGSAATPLETLELLHPRDGRGGNNPRPPGPAPLGFGGIAIMARSADNQTLVVARGNDVQVLRQGQAAFLRVQFPTVQGQRGRAPFLRSLAVSPRGDRLYGCVAGPESSVQAWTLTDDRSQAPGDATKNQVITAVTAIVGYAPRDVLTLALSPDGRQLALGEQAGSVAIVGTETGRLITKLPAPTDYEGDNRVSSLAFSPQGNELAVGTSDRVRLWALGESPQPIVWLPGHRGPILHLAYDPNGEHLATAGEDHVVQIWDLQKVHYELDKLGLDW